MVISRLLFYLGCLFIAQLSIRPALSITLSDFFFLASFLIALASCVANGIKPIYKIKPSIQFGAFLFIFGLLLTLAFSDTESSIHETFILNLCLDLAGHNSLH